MRNIYQLFNLVEVKIGHILYVYLKQLLDIFVFKSYLMNIEDIPVDSVNFEHPILNDFIENLLNSKIKSLVEDPSSVPSIKISSKLSLSVLKIIFSLLDVLVFKFIF